MVETVDKINSKEFNDPYAQAVLNFLSKKLDEIKENGTEAEIERHTKRYSGLTVKDITIKPAKIITGGKPMVCFLTRKTGFIRTDAELIPITFKEIIKSWDVNPVIVNTFKELIEMANEKEKTPKFIYLNDTGSYAFLMPKSSVGDINIYYELLNKIYFDKMSLSTGKEPTKENMESGTLTIKSDIMIDLKPLLIYTYEGIKGLEDPALDVTLTYVSQVPNKVTIGIASSYVLVSNRPFAKMVIDGTVEIIPKNGSQVITSDQLNDALLLNKKVAYTKASDISNGLSDTVSIDLVYTDTPKLTEFKVDVYEKDANGLIADFTKTFTLDPVITDTLDLTNDRWLEYTNNVVYINVPTSLKLKPGTNTQAPYLTIPMVDGYITYSDKEDDEYPIVVDKLTESFSTDKLTFKEEDKLPDYVFIDHLNPKTSPVWTPFYGKIRNIIKPTPPPPYYIENAEDRTVPVNETTKLTFIVGSDNPDVMNITISDISSDIETLDGFGLYFTSDEIKDNRYEVNLYYTPIEKKVGTISLNLDIDMFSGETTSLHTDINVTVVNNPAIFEVKYEKDNLTNTEIPLIVNTDIPGFNLPSSELTIEQTSGDTEIVEIIDKDVNGSRSLFAKFTKAPEEQSVFSCSLLTTPEGYEFKYHLLSFNIDTDIIKTLEPMSIDVKILSAVNSFKRSLIAVTINNIPDEYSGRLRYEIKPYASGDRTTELETGYSGINFIQITSRRELILTENKTELYAELNAIIKPSDIDIVVDVKLRDDNSVLVSSTTSVYVGNKTHTLGVMDTPTEPLEYDTYALYPITRSSGILNATDINGYIYPKEGETLPPTYTDSIQKDPTTGAPCIRYHFTKETEDVEQPELLLEATDVQTGYFDIIVLDPGKIEEPHWKVTLNPVSIKEDEISINNYIDVASFTLTGVGLPKQTDAFFRSIESRALVNPDYARNISKLYVHNVDLANNRATYTIKLSGFVGPLQLRTIQEERYELFIWDDTANCLKERIVENLDPKLEIIYSSASYFVSEYGSRYVNPVTEDTPKPGHVYFVIQHKTYPPLENIMLDVVDPVRLRTRVPESGKFKLVDNGKVKKFNYYDPVYYFEFEGGDIEEGDKFEVEFISGGDDVLTVEPKLPIETSELNISKVANIDNNCLHIVTYNSPTRYNGKAFSRTPMMFSQYRIYNNLGDHQLTLSPLNNAFTARFFPFVEDKPIFWLYGITNSKGLDADTLWLMVNPDPTYTKFSNKYKIVITSITPPGKNTYYSFVIKIVDRETNTPVTLNTGVNGSNKVRCRTLTSSFGSSKPTAAGQTFNVNRKELLKLKDVIFQYNQSNIVAYGDLYELIKEFDPEHPLLELK